MLDGAFDTDASVGAVGAPGTLGARVVNGLTALDGTEDSL